MTRFQDRLDGAFAKASTVVLLAYAATVLALFAGVLSPTLI